MIKKYWRYFCEYCGTEVVISDKSDEYGEWPHHCPLCLNDMKLLSDFETVDQWEKRTGEKLGDDAWVMWKNNKPNERWKIAIWKYVRELTPEPAQVVVFIGPYAPSVNYEVEREKANGRV